MNIDLSLQITIVTVMLIVAITIGVICRIQCQTIASSPMIPASPRTESDIHDKNLQSSYGELWVPKEVSVLHSPHNWD